MTAFDHGTARDDGSQHCPTRVVDQTVEEDDDLFEYKQHCEAEWLSTDQYLKPFNGYEKIPDDIRQRMAA
jgi:hypothetical protein